MRVRGHSNRFPHATRLSDLRATPVASETSGPQWADINSCWRRHHAGIYPKCPYHTFVAWKDPCVLNYSTSILLFICLIYWPTLFNLFSLTDPHLSINYSIYFVPIHDLTLSYWSLTVFTVHSTPSPTQTLFIYLFIFTILVNFILLLITHTAVLAIRQQSILCNLKKKKKKN